MPASEQLAARIRGLDDGRVRAALYLVASEHPAIAANAMDRTGTLECRDCGGLLPGHALTCVRHVPRPVTG